MGSEKTVSVIGITSLCPKRKIIERVFDRLENKVVLCCDVIVNRWFVSAYLSGYIYDSFGRLAYDAIRITKKKVFCPSELELNGIGNLTARVVVSVLSDSFWVSKSDAILVSLVIHSEMSDEAVRQILECTSVALENIGVTSVVCVVSKNGLDGCSGILYNDEKIECLECT